RVRILVLDHALVGAALRTRHGRLSLVARFPITHRRMPAPGRAQRAGSVLDLELDGIGPEQRGEHPVEADADLAVDAGHPGPVVAAPHEPGDPAPHPDP